MKLVESTEETHGNTILREKTNARNALLAPLLLCLAALYSHIFTVPAGGRSRLNRGAAVVEVRSKRFASGHREKP